MTVVKEFVLIFRSTIYSIASRIFLFDMQNIILEKFKKIDFKVFFTPKFHDLYFCVLNNYNSECFQMVTNTISLLCSLVELELTSVLMVLFAFDFKILIPLILFSVPSVLIGCKTQEKFLDTIKQNASDERKDAYIFHILTDKDFLKEIRSFNLEKYFGERRSVLFNIIINRWKKFGKDEFFRVLLSQFISFSGLYIAIYEIIHFSCNGRIDISSFVFYAGMIVSFKNSVSQISFELSESYRGILFINQIFEFLKFEEIKSSSNQNNKLQNKREKKHSVEFKNLNFKYCNSGKLILKNIDLKFNQGEKVCIIGRNGCGKSTLINLLLRHYYPTSGEILFDNKNIYSYDFEEYKKLFSVIYQDFKI